MFLKKTLTPDKVILLQILNSDLAKISSHNPECLGIISMKDAKNMNDECPHCSELTLYQIGGRDKGKAVKLNRKGEGNNNNNNNNNNPNPNSKKRKTDVTTDIITTHKSKVEPNDKSTLNDLILVEEEKVDDTFSLWKSFQNENVINNNNNNNNNDGILTMLSSLPPVLFFKMHEVKVLPFFISNIEETLPIIIEKRSKVFSEDYTKTILPTLTSSNYKSYIDKLNEEKGYEFEKLFSPVVQEPKGLQVREVKYGIEEKELGVFATDGSNIKGKSYGYFSGKVINTMDVPSISETGRRYIMEMLLKTDILGVPIVYGTIIIDPTVPQFTWHSRMNHKWSFDNISTNSGFDMPSDWRFMFANVKINDSLLMTSSRDIDEGEELSFDYGDIYWSGGDRPTWDISMAPVSFLEFLMTDTLHEEWKTKIEFLRGKDNSVTTNQFLLNLPKRVAVLKNNLFYFLKKSNIVGFEDKVRMLSQVQGGNELMFV